MKRRIRRLALVVTGCFTILMGYLVYLHLSPGIIEGSVMNSRPWSKEQNIVRGGIYDKKGEILAQNKDGKRYYPLGEATAHLLGYSSKKYGKAGIELFFDQELLGMNGWAKITNALRRVSGKTEIGNDLYLTIDAELQKRASSLLEKAGKGSIVVIEPTTGRILAAVSSPGFNPGELDKLWRNREKLEEDSNLLNRAFRGLYPPGSTFKLVTGGLSEDLGPVYNCPGYIEINGRKISCNGVHGNIDFFHALAYSCNTAFIEIALNAGGDALVDAATSAGFNKEIPFDVPVTMGRFPSSIKQKANAVAEAAMGQGEVEVTPLLMGMIVSAVANDGVMMKPYLIQSIKTPDGDIIKGNKPQKWLIPYDKAQAERIKEGMKMTVESGTGRNAYISGVEVAGKTGTAEVKDKKSHAWFVGFASVDNPRVAVAVLIENGGVGGEVAAPIAKELIKSALELAR